VGPLLYRPHRTRPRSHPAPTATPHKPQRTRTPHVRGSVSSLPARLSRRVSCPSLPVPTDHTVRASPCAMRRTSTSAFRARAEGDAAAAGLAVNCARPTIRQHSRRTPNTPPFLVPSARSTYQSDPRRPPCKTSRRPRRISSPWEGPERTPPSDRPQSRRQRRPVRLISIYCHKKTPPERVRRMHRHGAPWGIIVASPTVATTIAATRLPRVSPRTSPSRRQRLLFGLRRGARGCQA